MLNFLLMALLKAMAENSAKAIKGQPANATINPLDLIPGSPGTADTATMGNFLKNTGKEALSSLNPLQNAYADQSPTVNLDKIIVNPNIKQFDRMSYGGDFPQPNTIPSQYQGMGKDQMQPQPNQQSPDVGFIRGMINAATGQSQPKGLSDVSQGRRTAYHSGELIPNIIMSKLGQPSPAEVTSREMLNQYYQTGAQMYDPATGELTGTKVPARGVAQKKESPSEQKYSRELDFNASLKDWANGVVNDETGYKMMSDNFPDMQKQIDEYYFRKTGVFPIGKGRR